MAPPIFGRVAITLGIGPHSIVCSYRPIYCNIRGANHGVCQCRLVPVLYVGLHDDDDGGGDDDDNDVCCY